MNKAKKNVLFFLLFSLFVLPMFSENSGDVEETIVIIESAQKTEYKKIQEEDVVIFVGDVKLSVSKASQEIIIEADNVTFNRNRSTIYAEGNVLFTEIGKGNEASNESLTASSLLFNTETMEGVFDSARVVQESSKNINLSNGTTLIVSSDLFGKENSGTVTFKNGILTFCDDENPHWKIKASRIWLLPGNEFSFLNALLYVGNLPVFYLPFFYYPKDEMIFNPVFGYRPREGYYFQTTTYLLGRKPLQSNSNDEEEAGIFDFMKNTELMVQEREGLFLTNTEEKATMPKNSLKIMADVYSNLGGMIGIQGNFKDIGIISSLNFSTYLGFSNTLFQLNQNQFSKFSPSGKIYYDFSYLMGLKLPFRYYGNFEMNLAFSPFNLKISLPLHSDQWFNNDFLNRSESMDWISFLLEDSLQQEQPIKEISSYSWTASGSVSNPKWIKNLSPYVENLSISSISSSINFISKENQDINGEKAIYSPERKFFYPGSVYPLKVTMNMSGKLLSLYTNKPSKTEEYKSNNISILENPIEKENSIESISQPQKNEEEYKKTENIDETINHTFISEDFLPSINISKIQIQNIKDITLDISYSIKPTFISEISYFSEKYTTPQDINLSKIQMSYINLKSPFTLKSSLNLKNSFLTLTNSFDFSPVLQKHPKIDPEYENSNIESVNKIKLADYNNSNIELKNSNSLVFKPFVFLDNLKNFSLSWNTSFTLLKSKFTGEITNPKWEYDSVDWTSNTIGKNNLSASFSSSQYGGLISETITFTANLPPLRDSYSGTLKLAFPFCSNLSISFGIREKSNTDSSWVFDPIVQSSSWNFFDKKLTLTENFKYNVEEGHAENLSLTLKGFGLSASYTMNYTNPYKFSSGDGTWLLVNKKEFLPYELKFSYSMPNSNLSFFAGDFTFAPTLSSEINFDLIQITDCYFSLSSGFTVKITDALTFSFSAVSRNDVMYRYVQDWVGLEMELPGETNIFKDLFNSFAFWDRGLRQASGFKLKKLSITLAHDLHDWTLNSSFSLEPRLIKTSKPYRYDFSPYFTLSVLWKPMSSLKTTIEDKYGEFLLY